MKLFYRKAATANTKTDITALEITDRGGDPLVLLLLAPEVVLLKLELVVVELVDEVLELETATDDIAWDPEDEDAPDMVAQCISTGSTSCDRSCKPLMTQSSRYRVTIVASRVVQALTLQTLITCEPVSGDVSVSKLTPELAWHSATFESVASFKSSVVEQTAPSAGVVAMSPTVAVNAATKVFMICADAGRFDNER